MNTANLSQIKNELKGHSPEELSALILRLSKFKKENKELITYLLFEQNDEQEYILAVKEEVKVLFSEMNTSSYYYMKKTIRKVLRQIKKYIRYSGQKSTEAELLLFFCLQFKQLSPSPFRSTILSNIYHKQKELALKAVASLHEDLQLDFSLQIEQLDA